MALDPAAVALIERAKRALATNPDDPRTGELVRQARAVLDRAAPWQDVSALR